MNPAQLPQIESDISTSLANVESEWQHFVDTGKLSSGTVRSVIAESWMRCREWGINPREERAQSVITPDEIEAKLYTENLGMSGKVVLDSMAHIVEDTSHVIVLADVTGRILYSVGHRQIQDHLEKINFMPGSEWSESVAGPNGIGTSLALGRPELVMGAEHFCQGWQPWVCYGTPIRNPASRDALGCIDITGPSNKTCIEAMALAISVAQSIEANLTITQLKKREYLRRAHHKTSMRWPNDPSLVLDEYGNVIELSSSAGQMLDMSPSDFLQTTFDKKFPDLWIDVKSTLRDGYDRDSVVRLRNSLTGSAHCTIKSVVIKGERLGCVIIFRSGKRANNTRTSLRYNEDDLIRKTLNQTAGNISKAARILNIDRATIYRRRKQWQSSR